MSRMCRNGKWEKMRCRPVDRGGEYAKGGPEKNLVVAQCSRSIQATIVKTRQPERNRVNIQESTRPGRIVGERKKIGVN